MNRTFTSDLLWIGLALLLIAANGFFVAAEFSLVKIRKARLAQMVRAGRPFAKAASWLAERMDRSLSACQLGITMASLALGWIGEPAVAHLMRPVFEALGITSEAAIHTMALAVSFTLITAGHLVLGEQVPKIFALRKPEVMMLWCALPLQLFYGPAYPFLRGLDAATTAILRVLGVGGVTGHDTPHTEEELRSLLSQSRAHGELTRTEHRLVEAVFEFDEVICRQIMVPRDEVVFLDTRIPLSESLQVARRAQHSRYPVCDGSLDKVVGILHTKDLFCVVTPDDVDLRAVARPPKYVPETMPISALLRHFQATKQHMALVVDEYGVLVGVVTLENVLERIVGAVQDEFDVETPDIVPDGPGRFVVRGTTSITKLRELLGGTWDVDGVDTAAGLVLVTLGRVPAQGDRVELDDLTAEVLETRGNRATLLRVTVAGRSEDPDPQQATSGL